MEAAGSVTGREGKADFGAREGGLANSPSPCASVTFRSHTGITLGTPAFHSGLLESQRLQDVQGSPSAPFPPSFPMITRRVLTLGSSL